MDNTSDEVELIIEETRIEDVLCSSRSISENLIASTDGELIFSDTNRNYNDQDCASSSSIGSQLLSKGLENISGMDEGATSLAAITNPDEVNSEIEGYVKQLIISVVQDLGTSTPISQENDAESNFVDETFRKISIGVIREQCLDVAIEATLEMEISFEREQHADNPLPSISRDTSTTDQASSLLKSCDAKEIALQRVTSISHIPEKAKRPKKIIVQSSHSVLFPSEPAPSSDASADYTTPNNADAHQSNDQGLHVDVACVVNEQNQSNGMSKARSRPLEPSTEPAPVRGPPVPRAKYEYFEHDTVITKDMIADRKAAKLRQLRYGNKEPPREEPQPEEVPAVDDDILNMMKSTTAKLKAFDYSKIRGSKLHGRTPTHQRKAGNPLPKRYTKDIYQPPGNFFYDYEDLVRVNQEKEYYNLNDKELEKYLTTAEFERIFSMTREAFYDQPLWKQQAEKKSKKLF